MLVPLLALPGFDRLGQPGEDLERIAYDPQIGHLQNRRIAILVDRDDHLRALHADGVLHGAGDTGSDVHAWPDGLAGLTYLHRIWNPAGVDDGTACPRRAAQRVRQLMHEVEVLRPTQASAAGHDDPGVLELHLVAHLLDSLDHARSPGAFTNRGRHVHHRRLAAAFTYLERLGPNQDDGRPGVGAIRRHLGPAEVGDLGNECAVGCVDVHRVRDEPGAEPRGQPAGYLARVRAEAEQNQVRVLLRHQCRQAIGC